MLLWLIRSFFYSTWIILSCHQTKMGVKHSRKWTIHHQHVEARWHHVKWVFIWMKHVDDRTIRERLITMIATSPEASCVLSFNYVTLLVEDFSADKASGSMKKSLRRCWCLNKQRVTDYSMLAKRSVNQTGKHRKAHQRLNVSSKSCWPSANAIRNRSSLTVNLIYF